MSLSCKLYMSMRPLHSAPFLHGSHTRSSNRQTTLRSMYCASSVRTFTPRFHGLPELPDVCIATKNIILDSAALLPTIPGRSGANQESDSSEKRCGIVPRARNGNFVRIQSKSAIYRDMMKEGGPGQRRQGSVEALRQSRPVERRGRWWKSE
jgi:hypothetical protein